MNLPCPRTVSISEFRIQFEFKLNFTWHNARHSVPQNGKLASRDLASAASSMPLRQCSENCESSKIVKVVKSVELTLTKN